MSGVCCDNCALINFFFSLLPGLFVTSTFRTCGGSDCTVCISDGIRSRFHFIGAVKGSLLNLNLTDVAIPCAGSRFGSMAALC